VVKDLNQLFEDYINEILMNSGDREWGKPSLANDYKKMTPGQEKADTPHKHTILPKNRPFKSGTRHNIINPKKGKGSYNRKSIQEIRKKASIPGQEVGDSISLGGKSTEP
jgi:hypothetical protein